MKFKFLSERFVFICLIFLLIFSIAEAQSLNAKWKQNLSTSLEQFLQCQSSRDKNGCSNYIGQSLQTVYEINDFYSSSLGRYLTASEIARQLKENKTWTLLGPSYEQKTLITAQEFANANKAVVAVYMNPENIGHVVLIIPGQLTTSGSWGMRVPNAASFLSSEPDRSFVDKGLSYAFTKNMLKDIFIYTRDY